MSLLPTSAITHLPAVLSLRPRRDVEPGALVGRAFAHVGVAVRAQHVDGARERLLVGALAGDEHDTRLDFVADLKIEADPTPVVEEPLLLPIGELARARAVTMYDAALRA